jgi:hypothetical protein
VTEYFGVSLVILHPQPSIHWPPFHHRMRA